ncbi:hypothetical protein [Rhodococcus sp. OK519]|uniref:hypothetical protein n=1 Tax=Rhodococcus sp. OK519 TaxID=2135729 RepID=UPI0011B23920
MSTAITLACMSALAGFVYWYMPRDRPQKRFRLEQFRPATSFVGVLDEPGYPIRPGRAGFDAEEAATNTDSPAPSNWTGPETAGPDGRPVAGAMRPEDARSRGRALD